MAVIIFQVTGIEYRVNEKRIYDIFDRWIGENALTNEEMKSWANFKKNL